MESPNQIKVAIKCDGCPFEHDREGCMKNDCPSALPIKASDIQIGGKHYKRSIQPFDIYRVWNLGPFRANIVKYILRAPYKNKLEDLKKAQHYLQYIIENYEDITKELGNSY